jgi:hypothetical protein
VVLGDPERVEARLLGRHRERHGVAEVTVLAGVEPDAEAAAGH